MKSAVIFSLVLFGCIFAFTLSMSHFDLNFSDFELKLIILGAFAALFSIAWLYDNSEVLKNRISRRWHRNNGKRDPEASILNKTFSLNLRGVLASLACLGYFISFGITIETDTMAPFTIGSILTMIVAMWLYPFGGKG
jgi:hypothetical protein